MTERAFGEVLKDLREQRSLTHDELAVKAGLSQGLISKYETGARNGTRASALKIARVLAAFRGGDPEGAYYAIVNALLKTLPNEPPELRPGESLTYVTDPDAAIVAEAYEGLPTHLKSYVKSQVLSAAELARKMDQDRLTLSKRADHDDNPSRPPED